MTNTTISPTAITTTIAPLIEVNGVCKDFGATRALHDINLTVARGEIVVLLGLSGSGKSTLLRHLDGLDSPTSGAVSVLDRTLTESSSRELRALRGRIGMIFQQFELVGPLTVLENVLTGALAQLRGPRLGLGTYPKSLRRKALGHLDRVGLLHKAYERADQLSGGQQQRVAIARALMQDPEILLADEPVASLDPDSSAQVMALIREIAADRGLTVVCSLHQVELALEWSDRVVGLRAGEVVLDTPTAELSRERAMTIYRQVGAETGENDLRIRSGTW
ncbi:phosphonate ABC transporter ATP-binding protein [Gordonia amicalis]|uniref:phosphonate ABC transporter ATP-binding protein n=1 Tax=Gordonia amicalis TaxID=89053 RepID=UPI0015F67D4C|nr:phosphonate ABC transporter ATP-binding protein [Gordonia amicalis]MBA5848004.1 phosphonate ABC transporter ATP-binding protein [Gordonia amicalis]UOG21711.1 phosphonate ABC transporter ATP-binding protein [Gordonia amicalis]